MNEPLVTVGCALLVFIGVVLPAAIVLAVIERVQIRRNRRREALLANVESVATDAIAVVGQIAGRSVGVGTYGKRGRTNKSKALAAADEVLRKVDEN